MKRIRNLHFSRTWVLIFPALFMVLAISLSGSAQDVEDFMQIESSEKLKSNHGSITEIIGYDSTGLYVLKERGRRYWVVRYNLAMQEIYPKQLDLSFGEMDHNPEYLFLYAGKLWLFSSYLNRSQDELQLYLSYINPKSLERIGEERQIAAVKRSGRLFKSEGHFDLRFSKGKERMAIITHYPFAKNEFEKVKVNLFSSTTGEVQWEKEFEIPYKEDLFAIESTRIDGDGNFYVLGKRYADGLVGKMKETKDGEKNYGYVIVGYFNNGQDQRNFELQLEDKYISDLQLAINQKGEMICAGFYTNTDRSGLSGSYFMRLNPLTKEVITQSLKEFNIDFVTQNFSQKAKKKAKKREAKGKEVGLTKYELDEMVLRDDGGVMLIGEQYFVEVVSYSRQGPNGMTTMQTTNHYYHNDIIVVNINAQGQIEWTDKIPKRQHTTNDGGFYNSYLLGARGDKIFIIFNDNPKNLNLAVNPAVGRFATFTKQNNSIVTLVALDVEGRNTRMSLLSLKDEGLLSRPAVSAQVNKSTLILLAQRGRHEKLFRLRMSD